MPRIILRPGRDRAVRRRHPWVLSGAVERVEGDAGPGDSVAVVSAEGEVLGHGHYSPASQIRVRLLHFGKEDPGEEALAARVRAAVARRARLPGLAATDAVRLVNAEGDGLPGLVVDRYGDAVVLRLSSAGMVARRAVLASAIRSVSAAAAGYERADAAALRREGLPIREGVLWGAAPTGPVSIHEADRRYQVDLASGQKTGFYLDQRDARALVAKRARGRRALDLFAYSGSFSVAAARGGAASVTLVESSRPALTLAQANLEMNGARREVQLVCEDAFRFLRQTHAQWDLLVLDPPPFARRQADLPRATRAYKDLILQGLRHAAPGAWMLAFACSHHVSPELFRKIAFGASLDAGRSARVLRTLEAPPDHAVSLDHPEGRYLTGLWLEID